MAFEFSYCLSGTAPHIETSVIKDTIEISEGEVLTLEAGGGAASEVDAGATGDTTFAGVALEDVDNTNDGLSVRYVANPDAVFSVADANVRGKGDLLDLASGGLGVTTASNNDFIVVKDSTATERTLVAFNSTHAYQL